MSYVSDSGGTAPSARPELLGDGSYGVLYAVAGVGAMLGALAILPVKGVR